MSILSNDLVLVKSSVMSDAPDAGGGMTSNVIADGASNNMFSPISTLARTYGEVECRKVFGLVNTQSDDVFYGSHFIVSKLPKDQMLGVNLFNTADFFDRRADAALRIENYRAQGSKYLGFLYGTQYKGSQTLTLFQSVAIAVPASGDVLYLLIPATGINQYVRLTNVTSTVQTFTNNYGVFTRCVVSAQISSPLIADFVGTDISNLDSASPFAEIYNTAVANAARYYSARPLADSAALGDFALYVDTVYSQVVPSSQSETPLIDITAAGSVSPLVQASQGELSFPLGFAIGAGVNVYLGRACTPGSLAINYGGGQITDKGGQVLLNGTPIGTINYAAGSITFALTAPSISGATVYFIPAGAPFAIADTDSIPVTDASRAFVYTLNINPPPQPNALSISYMALGEWYVLQDDGSGGLVSSVAGVGSGQINYVTGSLAVTFAALPDVGSEIIFAWGKKVDYTDRSGSAVAMTITKQLTYQALDPTSFVTTWTDNGVTRRIVSNAAGVLSGDGTGQLTAITGVVVFKPNPLPIKGTVFSISYLYGAGSGSAAKASKTLTAFNMTGNTVALDIGDTHIVPGSVVVDWAIPWGSSTTMQDTDLLNKIALKNAYIDLPIVSSGELVREELDNATGGFVSGNRGAAIDYVNGLITFNWSDSLNLPYPLFAKLIYSIGFGSTALKAMFMGYVNLPAIIATPGEFNVTYRTQAATTAATDSVTLSEGTVDLSVGFTDPLVPESLVFDFAGYRYIDRLGQLYTEVDPSTGVGMFAGTVDYVAGVCQLQTWAIGGSNTGQLQAGLSSSGYDPIAKIVLRTVTAPIKASSFSIRAVPVGGGGQISATANDAGVIQTASMFGTINYDTGVADIHFGAMVAAAGNESQSWFDASNVVNGQVFQPMPVLASSIIYNAVSYTYIPLSESILGLDPVRLPLDGRIPVYQTGDVVVVLNDQATTGTFASNSTTDIGRVRLAKVTVKDLGGNALDSTKYSVNLDTGIISWYDLSGISQPLTVTARIEDMAVLSDVQITGKLTLSKPLTHAYDPLTTLVANAVVTGDLYARTSVPFDQQFWSNQWSDSVIGNSTSAQFNATQYPIIVTNDSTIEESWLLLFTSMTTFNVIGQNSGQVITGASTSVDVAPINPATNAPYFTLNYLGFGGGWAAGNCLRFDTYPAAAPVWVVQSVGQGNPTDPDYSFCLEFRGDIAP